MFEATVYLLCKGEEKGKPLRGGDDIAREARSEQRDKSDAGHWALEDARSSTNVKMMSASRTRAGALYLPAG